MSAVTHAPAIELLAAILAGTPRLPGRAACRDHVELFDRTADGDRQAAEDAVAICQSCPVLETCQQWIAGAHPQRPPPGVLAAQFTPPPTQRKKATT